MSKQLAAASLLFVLLVVLAVVNFTSVKEVPIETPVVETPVVEAVPATSTAVIGQSVQGLPLEVYTYGTGETDLLFVGGIHGGYEWNSIVLAYQMMDHLAANLETVPEKITVHIIPNLNPDGLNLATGITGRFAVTDITSNAMHQTGAGRFNANNVDLNRNFDCRWTPKSTWRTQEVSAGSEPFSEPEAAALRDYVHKINPTAAVFWHSMADNVYGSECGAGVSAETLTLLSAYAQAAGYGEVPVFDAYVVTGAAEDWLASIGIPAVTVELGSRTNPEWEQNLAGTLAVLELYR